MAPRLRTISSKRFAKSCETDLVAYCDPHDLIAVVTIDSDVVVYRINGQIAFMISNPNDGMPMTAISWKEDGSRLAIGWPTGEFSIHSGEDGRLLHSESIRGPDDPDSDDPVSEDHEGFDDNIIAVTGFGWTKHRLDRVVNDNEGGDPQSAAGTQGHDHFDDQQSVHDSLGESRGSDHASPHGSHDNDEDPNDPDVTNAGPTRQAVHAISRLTRALMTMDVTEVLPRLSSIPSHGLRLGVEGNKFSTQASTDTILEPHKVASPNEVDTLMVLSSNSKVTVMLDDTVKIGTCAAGWRPMMHASTSYSPLHAVIAHDNFEQNYEVSFSRLPLETLGGRLLSVIATNTKRLKNLTDYIIQTVHCIEHDYVTGIQTPNRFIASANATLAEGSQGDLKVNLVDLALTGKFTPPLLEWLTDILREPNHKRWDQAISGMYTNIQNHLFVNLILAIDRLTTAVTTLRGHARVAENSRMFNIEPDTFDKILDITDSLRFVALHVQSLVIDERQRFSAFSKWLRVMIEVGVAVPGSKSATETEEREVPNMDYQLILAYINQNIGTISPVASFIQRLTADFDLFAAYPSVHKQTMSVLASANFDGNWAAVNMQLLAANLDATIATALARITDWQSKMLTRPSTQDIQTPPKLRLADMVMHKTGAVAVLATCPADGQRQKLFVATVTDPPQRPALFQGVHLTFEQELVIRHARFINQGQDLLILTKSPDNCFELHRARLGTLVRCSEERTPLSTDVSHVHDTNDDFDAQCLQVGHRKGKEVCVVVGGKGWLVLNMNEVEVDETGDSMVM